MKTRQCKAKLFFWDLKCQGESGHKGNHWCYSTNGDMNEWKNKNDKKAIGEGISIIITPSDSKSYKHPKTMRNKYFMALAIKRGE